MKPIKFNPPIVENKPKEVVVSYQVTSDGGEVDGYNFTIKAEKQGTSQIQILPLDEWDNEYKINVVVE